MKNLVCSFLCLILFQHLEAGKNSFEARFPAMVFLDTLPAPPSFLRCGDGKKGYGLYWTDKSTTEVRFKIYRAVNSALNFSFFAEVASNTAATTGTEFYYKTKDDPESFHTYKVTAADHSGESIPSNLAFIPRRPTGLSGAADSISVTLDWTYPDDHWIQLIFIERSKKPDSGFNIMAPIVSQNGVKYIDYSPEKGIDYFYRIRGAFYQPDKGVTCYTLPTDAVGPFRISAAGRDNDGELNYQGRNYKIKSFGNQTWMVENLAYLPVVYPPSDISSSEKRYYVYGFQGSSVSEARKSENYKAYGVLYNWSAAADGALISPKDTVGVQGICPPGWHLAANKEWMDLNGILDRIRTSRDSAIRSDARKKGIKGFQTTRFEGDFAMPDFNEFNVPPGGFLQGDSNKFDAIGKVGNFWSSTSRIFTDKGFYAALSGKGSGYSVRCLKGAAFPSVSTGDISSITETSAISGVHVVRDGGAPVTERGVCWNTTGNPGVSNHSVSDQSGKTTFTGYLPDLTSRTTYYVRAYATNSYGTGYGQEKQFTTGEGGGDGTLDYQGRTYAYKKIGTQTWMTENLAYLPSVSPSSVGSAEDPYYYVYNFEGFNVDSARSFVYYQQYGVLYNWTAAKTACPSGWHLPDDKEVNVLMDYLTNYGYGFGGSGKGIAKSLSATSGWDSIAIPGSVGYDQVLNNRSGFNALPAGQRTAPLNGMTSNHRKAANFWTTSEFNPQPSSAFALIVFYSHDVVHPYPNADKRNGYSVRCLKDNP